MNIEKITIDGKDYVPMNEFKFSSCLGCDFYQGTCHINKLCKCIGDGLILKRDGKGKPVEGDYTTIMSYEDACLATGTIPVYLPGQSKKSDRDLANEQLEVIAMSFRKQDPKPGVHPHGASLYYVPIFELFTEDEIRQLPEHVQQSALWVTTYVGERKLLSSRTHMKILTSQPGQTSLIPLINHAFFQHSEEESAHFASRQFIQIWATYLDFEYEQSDFYIKQ